MKPVGGLKITDERRRRLESAAMDRGVAVILMALVGGLIALQPAVNAGLGRATGNIAAALVSFAIGTALLAVIVVIAGQASGLANTFDVPWYYLLGGILGAAYVFTALVTVSSIGAGGVAAATITGQLTAGDPDRPPRRARTREDADHPDGDRRRPAARRHVSDRPLILHRRCDTVRCCIPPPPPTIGRVDR